MSRRANTLSDISGLYHANVNGTAGVYGSFGADIETMRSLCHANVTGTAGVYGSFGVDIGTMRSPKVQKKSMP